MFETGTLWDSLTRASANALESGTLHSIPTEYEFVEDANVRFLVRIVTNLARKHHAKVESGGGGKQSNPFLPYDPEMYVADASETHVCLLNKFNVVDHHLLIVTREFEHQQSPLNHGDFEALWRCMEEYDSLGFYNGGTISGASQPHKHLQLVPLPMAPEGPRIPVEPLLEAADVQDGSGRAAGLPFPHVFTRIAPERSATLSDAAEMTLSLYGEMMNSLGLHSDVAQSDRIDRNYNLLVTRQWMLLVPRGRERFESISLNALAFAGALLVREESEMAALRNHGPMKALEYVTDA